MLHIYLDTALMSVPNYAYGADQSEVQELIDRVLHFHSILSETLPLRIVVADDIENVLGVDYPTHDNIEAFLEATELRHVYSANDLYESYLTVLDRAVRPEQIRCFEILSVSSFASTPPLPAGLGPARLLTETQRIFSAVAVHFGEPLPWMVGSALNGRNWSTFNINAVVANASHDPSPRDGALSFAFDRPASVIGHLSQLVNFSLANELWSKAQNAEQVHFAISLGALAIRRARFQDSDEAGIRPFSIGSGFLTSLAEYNCGGALNFSDTTFELCAKIVANLGLVEISPMGRPHQLERALDNALALRCQITTGNPALRLLLWETATKLEFANVGLKKELFIEPGSPSSSASVDLSQLL